MTLVRWNPKSLDREIDSLVRNFWGDVAGRNAGADWSPRVDITEHEDRFELTAELPGMTQDDISVQVKDNILVIEGEKKRVGAAPESNSFRTERSYGTFRRSFQLGDRVDCTRIEAGYKDGILTLNVPKAEELKPRNIEVKVS